MAALPFRCLFHQVGGVLEHELAEVLCSIGGIDLTPEALLNQKGDPAAVVDMGMGEEHGFQSTGLVAKAILIPIGIASLKEACIYANSEILGIKDHMRTSNPSGSSIELQLHGSELDLIED